MSENNQADTISRRGIIKKAISIAVGLPVGFGAVAAAHQKREPQPSQTKTLSSDTPTPIPSPTPEDTITDYTKVYQDPVGEKMNAYRMSVRKAVAMLLKDETQKKHIASGTDTVVHQIVLHYLKRNELESDLKLVSDSKWSVIAQEVAQRLGIERESFMTQLLPGLILTESTGDPRAVSPSGAEGLCQLKAGVAQQMYFSLRQRYDKLLERSKTVPKIRREADNLQKALAAVKFRTDVNMGAQEIDRNDPKTNITLALEYLNYLYKLFPDPSLALWAYHMGPGNMIRAVAATRGIPEVAAEQLLEDVNKYEVAGKAVTTIKELIRGKSNESMLDFTVLFDDPTVGRRLSNIKIRDPENKSEVKIISAWDDDTYFYVARVIGGKVLLDEYNQKPKMAA